MKASVRPSSRLLDVDAAAEYLSVRPRYVRRLVQERRIPVQLVGKFVRLRRDELDSWLDAQRREVLP